MSKVNIDGILKEWGDKLFYEPVHARRRRRTATGELLKTVPPNTRSMDAEDKANRVRRMLKLTARKAPEVVIKISGGGKGMKSIKNHFGYISRNGRLEIEDQDGNKIRGRDEIKDLRDEWKYGKFGISEQSTKKEAFNIILSMPPGTDREAVRTAASGFAQNEFHKNHQYILVQHEDENHPHVHVCVKARGFDGTRLNPRKADLQRWREYFAEKLREQGIEANATRRPVRFVTKKHTRQQILHMEKSGRKTNALNAQREAVYSELKEGKKQPNPLREKIIDTRASIKKAYSEITNVLSRSEDPKDKALATEVKEFVGRVKPPKTRREEAVDKFRNEKERYLGKTIDNKIKEETKEPKIK
mgnify:CR=1 FL=1|jgi:hypothetical protein